MAHGADLVDGDGESPVDRSEAAPGAGGLLDLDRDGLADPRVERDDVADLDREELGEGDLGAAEEGGEVEVDGAR